MMDSKLATGNVQDGLRLYVFVCVCTYVPETKETTRINWIISQAHRNQVEERWDNVNSGEKKMTAIDLNALIILGNLVILTVLVTLIHEHSISFHLFVLSSVSLVSVLWFSKYRSFTSLVRFTPRYFIPFCCVCNEFIFKK